ncbi:MAG: DUF411 domain-containing protein [Gemmatimonadota bacterium]|nr:DUF411 domain-containing protein [Gemmatimonadota bacterium]
MKNQTKWIMTLVALVAVVVLGTLYRGHAEPAFAAQHSASALVAADAPVVTVYKNPTCACCAEWAEHLKKSGFRVEMKEGADLNAVKRQHGVTMDLASCHTAEVTGYVLEGHIPADVIRQLLAEKPDMRGLAVPGMPAGVPGMPEAGPNRAPYEIFAIEQGRGARLYATR